MEAKTVGLIAGGVVLGALVMTFSMKRGKHTALGSNFLAAGGGIAAGATAAHLLGEKK